MTAIKPRIEKVKATKIKMIKSCQAILDISMKRIQKQGCGCIDYSGCPDYKNGKLRDSIAILVESSQIRNSDYREIGHNDMTHLVNLIAKKFSVNLDLAGHRFFFTEFLQKLQDAHDDSFDVYLDRNVTPEEAMVIFTKACNQIKEYLQKELTKL